MKPETLVDKIRQRIFTVLAVKIIRKLHDLRYKLGKTDSVDILIIYDAMFDKELDPKDFMKVVYEVVKSPLVKAVNAGPCPCSCGRNIMTLEFDGPQIADDLANHDLMKAFVNSDAAMARIESNLKTFYDILKPVTSEPLTEEVEQPLPRHFPA